MGPCRTSAAPGCQLLLTIDAAAIYTYSGSLGDSPSRTVDRCVRGRGGSLHSRNQRTLDGLMVLCHSHANMVCAALLILLSIANSAAVAAAGSARTPNVIYRSIIGDAGMRWSQSNDGPRMHFMSRNLCAKAGPAEMSVLPMDGDTCALPSLPAGMSPGRGEVKRVNASDCCRACLAEWWCRAWTEPLAGVCSLKDNALPTRSLRNATVASAAGVRRYTPAQVLPSPRYANCVVNGSQAVSQRDNAARVPAGVDDEWFAAVKEQTLAARCEKPAGPLQAGRGRSSYFWSVMTTNENGWHNLGTDAEVRVSTSPPPHGRPLDGAWFVCSLARLGSPLAHSPPPPTGS